MLVGGVGTLDVGDGVARAQAGKGVDVAVRVVACQVSVVEPQHAFGMEHLFQPLFDVGLSHGLVAVGGQQALAGGEEGASAVALDASSLQHKVGLVHIGAVEGVQGHHASAYLVVERGLELFSPSVELEVHQLRTLWAGQRDEAMVARPRVVGGYFQDGNLPERLAGQLLAKQAPQRIGLWRHDDEPFPEGYLHGHAQVASGHLGEDGCPVGVGMRPCELYAALGCPLGRQMRLLYAVVLRVERGFELQLQRKPVAGERGDGRM